MRQPFQPWSQRRFFVCCDGLKGLPEAAEATWPNSLVQTCIVHLIRAANRWVTYGDHRGVSAAFKKIYTAPDEPSAAAALAKFEASELGEKYPRSVKGWQDARAVCPVSAVPTSSQESNLYNELH